MKSPTEAEAGQGGRRGWIQRAHQHVGSRGRRKVAPEMNRKVNREAWGEPGDNSVVENRRERSFQTGWVVTQNFERPVESHICEGPWSELPKDSAAVGPTGKVWVGGATDWQGEDGSVTEPRSESAQVSSGYSKLRSERRSRCKDWGQFRLKPHDGQVSTWEWRL